MLHGVCIAVMIQFFSDSSPYLFNAITTKQGNFCPFRQNNSVSFFLCTVHMSFSAFNLLNICWRYKNDFLTLKHNISTKSLQSVPNSRCIQHHPCHRVYIHMISSVTYSSVPHFTYAHSFSYSIFNRCCSPFPSLPV